MEQILQSILVPPYEEIDIHYGLFYRGRKQIVDREQQIMQMADKSIADFTTYINGCSYGKWREYTDIKGLKLRLDVQGKFAIILVGYHLDIYSPVRKEYGRFAYDFSEKTSIELEFPANEESMLGFEIEAIQDFVLYGGKYVGEYEEASLRNVELCLATTTCKKEKFITSNVEKIKREILEDESDDMRNHFYVHVVDNGRTLDPEKMKSWHVNVHPNKNTGGSGGFSRGMIESLAQTPKATHVLLMDDDVVVLPESLKRTYRLLTLVNDKYKDAFISGAMLYLEEMNIQHEDIGTLRRNCDFWSLKGRLYQNNIFDNLMNEQKHYGSDKQYAGWWYCCIPASTIEEKGLSLPIFIRCDDMEYSLRCNATIMTMNGIGIWHMGFVNKYNLAFDRYQQCRNLLIDKAVGSIADDVDVEGFVMKSFRIELLRFNYNGARLVLRALQDYMRGPEWIEQDLGEQIVQENAKLNEKYKPLEEFPGNEWWLGEVHDNPPRKFLSTWWFRITYNGQRLWPVKWLKKGVRAVKFDFTYQPQKYVRQSKMLAVNPDLKTATMREIDKKQYKEIKREWDKTFKKFKRENDMLRKQYRDAMPYMTSVDFWKKYLEIN